MRVSLPTWAYVIVCLAVLVSLFVADDAWELFSTATAWLVLLFMNRKEEK
jgi:hypothetical protein